MWNVVIKTEKEKEEEQMKKEGEWHKDKGVNTQRGSYGAAVRVCEWLGWGSNRATAAIEWGLERVILTNPPNDLLMYCIQLNTSVDLSVWTTIQKIFDKIKKFLGGGSFAHKGCIY